MRTIKLQFVNGNHLSLLLADNLFMGDIQYLQPSKFDDKNIVLTDPIIQHGRLESEMVVLSIFARGIKRVIFPNTKYEIEFLDPYVGHQKGGLVYNDQKIIDSTDIQL